METQKSCTESVVFWTPAPIHTSPTSSLLSEDVWEDEDEEQAQKDDDFVSQMDENGIIGLSEILEGLKLGGTCNAEFHPNHGPLTPEDTDLSPEELSFNATGNDLIGSLKTQTMDEDESQRKEEQGIGCFPERNKYLEMAEEERDVELGERINGKQIKREHWSTSKKTMTRNGLTEEDTELMNSTQSCSTQLLVIEPPGDSNRHCPIFQPASPATDSVLPHLLLTSEEIAAPGIETETIPDLSLLESLSETHRSHMRSSPRSSQPVAMFSEQVVSDHYGRVTNGSLKGSHESDKDCKQHTLSSRKMRQQSPEAACSPRSFSPASTDRETRTTSARGKTSGVGVSSKGRLSDRPPDFSKVKPRVHVPKGGYKPPKSRLSFKKDSLSPEPPLMFKSPADIVKEVLLNMPDGPPATSDSSRTSASAPNFTVPQEFRSRQQATMLLEQLQENYNSLLIKYAEAENTIDRLRLEAKMNLYSDPPKPGHLIQSGLSQEASNFMVLDFPQAQRAVTSSACHHSDEGCTHQDTSSACPLTRRPDSLVKQQPAKILYNQAGRLLHQLQTFESLLKCRKLKPFEEVKGLSQLADGLQYLETGYLLAKDEHKLLLQQEKESSPFDPERELEGLIFQCGLHMDELKEQVQQTQQGQPTCDIPPSSPPDFGPSSVPLEQGDSLTRPEVDPGEATLVELHSASEESNEEKDHEETVNSLYLKPMNGKYRHTKEFAMLSNDCQNLKELSKPFDPNLRDEKKEEQSQESTNLEVQNSLLQRKSDLEESPHGKQQSRRSSSRKIEVGKSHSRSLSSLGEITVERKSSELQCWTSRVLSQDGIISPEIDSGFVCSESSHLTPSATPSPHHQGPPESVPATQEGNSGKPHAGLVLSTLPASSPSHSHTAIEPSGGCQLNTNLLRRSRQGQRRHTSSQQRCFGQRERSMTNSGASEFVLESDSTPTVSEDPYTESINSLQSSSQRSSPTARHQHGDSSSALSSSPVVNVAIQTLQAEVTNLQEKLERCLKNKKPVSSDAACPSAQGGFTHHRTSTPRIRFRSMERWDDVSRARREDEESVVKRMVRMRPSSDHRQKPRSDIQPTMPQPLPLGSRCAQPSCTNTVRSKTHPRKCPGVPVQVCETADEPDSRSRQASLCPQFLSYQPVRPEAGGNKELTYSSPCHHCALCGCPEPHRSTEPDCCRLAHATRQMSRTPAEPAAAAPPALLQCMPVCPLPLLLHTSSLYVSPINSSGTSAEVRVGEDVERRMRRLLSANEQRSVDSSLRKAIRAARHMRLTSGHMARSLATGLHYRHQLNSLHELHR